MTVKQMRMGTLREAADIEACDAFLKALRDDGWPESELNGMELLWWKTLPIRKTSKQQS